MTMLLALAVPAAIIFIVFWLGVRGKASPPKPARKTPERIAKEEELLQRLERLRRRRDRVAEAIDEDPERAARIVSRMMKDRKQG